MITHLKQAIAAANVDRHPEGGRRHRPRRPRRRPRARRRRRTASTRRSSTTGRRSTSGSLAERSRRSWPPCRSQAIDDIKFVQAKVRRSPKHSATSLTDFEVETLPGVLLGQRNIPVARGRRLRAGRPLPADRLGAHDDRDREGRRRASGSPPAPRRSAARSRPPPSPPCTWPAPTRSTCSAASRRSPPWPSAPRRSAGSTCSPARATPTSPRPSGSFRRGRHRPVRRPDRDPGRRRRHADPFIVAVDLLSQAEHGPDSPAVLITTSRAARPRGASPTSSRSWSTCPPRDFAGPAWRDHGQVLVVDDLDEAFARGRHASPPSTWRS